MVLAVWLTYRLDTLKLGDRLNSLSKQKNAFEIVTALILMYMKDRMLLQNIGCRWFSPSVQLGYYRIIIFEK
jgi:hypothetical protein